MGLVKRIQIILLLPLLTGCLFSTRAPSKPPVDVAPTAAPLPSLQQSPTPSLTPTPPASDTPDLPTSTPPLSTSIPDPFQSELPLAEPPYELPLTTRHVTGDSAVLFFELSHPAAGVLLYRPAAGEAAGVKMVPLTPDQTRQQITLQDLTPNTEYLAQVGLEYPDGTYRQPAFLGEAWGAIRFRTASGIEPLRVGVLGDASFGDQATETLVARMSTYDLDFVIHTGDVVAEIGQNNGPVEAYALKYYKTLAPLLHQLPVYTVIGNHDYDAPARWQDSYFYYYAFPPLSEPDSYQIGRPDSIQYYAFSYNHVQFLMLDSQVFFGVPGRAEQDAWMAERLADPSFQFTIPVFHVPPFFSGSVHPTDGLPVRQFWHPVFVDAGVPLALSGHSHHYERLFADGTTYIVSGGGSSVLYAPGQILPQSQVYARRTHFVLLEIYSDRIDLTAISKEGDVLDQTTLPIHQPAS